MVERNLGVIHFTNDQIVWIKDWLEKIEQGESTTNDLRKELFKFEEGRERTPIGKDLELIPTQI